MDSYPDDMIRRRMTIMGAFDPAIQQMRRMLFQPFDLAVWFSLGVIIFLDQLGRGGSGGSSFNYRGGGGGGNGNFDLGGSMQQARDWVMSNLPIVLTFGVFILIVVIAFVVLLLWLSSRGQVMFVRSVALADSRVGDNWRATREAAHSLFLFRLALLAATSLVGLAIVAVGMVLVFGAASTHPSGIMPYVLAALPAILVLVAFGLAVGIVNVLQRNFVTPLMWHFNLPVMAAWSHFGRIAQGNVLTIFLFIVIRFFYHIPAMVVAMLVGCATCCIGFLPVISQTLLAPFYVFDRAFSLFVLSSLGPDYNMVPSYVDPLTQEQEFPSAPLLDVIPPRAHRTAGAAGIDPAGAAAG